jgi:WD40 repeat protein
LAVDVESGVVYMGCADGTVKCWNAKNESVVAEFKRSAAAITCLYSRNGHIIVGSSTYVSRGLTSGDGSLCRIKMDGTTLADEFIADDEPVFDISVSKAHMYAATRSGSVFKFRLE